MLPLIAILAGAECSHTARRSAETLYRGMNAGREERTGTWTTIRSLQSYNSIYGICRKRDGTGLRYSRKCSAQRRSSRTHLRNFREQDEGASLAKPSKPDFRRQDARRNPRNRAWCRRKRTGTNRSRNFRLIVYRLTRRRYSDMTGGGARRVGGRCNYMGVAAVYTSAHVSLAVLEVLVHLDKSEIPDDYVLMGLQMDHREIPEADAAGAKEMSGSRSVPVIAVRSIVVPRELNYVLYPDATGLAASVSFIEPFAFDHRLFVSARMV